jgi:hypothetical protein
VDGPSAVFGNPLAASELERLRALADPSSSVVASDANLDPCPYVEDDFCHEGLGCAPGSDALDCRPEAAP